VAGAAGGVPERTGEEGLPDAHGAEEDHVLLPLLPLTLVDGDVIRLRDGHRVG
jgi:hypothetical protein